MMEPSVRKPAGIALICAIVAVWVVIVASASGLIARLPGLLEALDYLVAGTIWILPMKPILSWMETGKWRE